MENIFKDFTEDQLWGNFESDFFRCQEPEFIDRLEELMIKNESIRIDYLIISKAVEFTDYHWSAFITKREIIFTKDKLVEMVNRKKIYPSQKHLAERYLRKLKYDYFYMF